MEKAYKIRHIPTGKYLSRYTGERKWTLGPKGRAWSCKLYSLIKGGIIIDNKLIPESEFEFVELTTIDKNNLIKKIETLKDTNKYDDDIYICAWRDGNNSAIENALAIIKGL